MKMYVDYNVEMPPVNKKLDNKMWAFILSGGLSRRMGRDKGTLHLEGETLTRKKIQWLSPYFNQIGVLVSSQNLILYRDFNCQVLVDLMPQRGPLGALYTAFKKTEFQSALFISCDFMAEKLDCEPLLEYHLKTEFNPSVCLRNLNDGPFYPLFILNRSVGVELEKLISKQKPPGLKDFFDQIRIEFIDSTQIIRDLDSPQDLEQFLMEKKMTQSLHDFELKTLAGKPLPLSHFKGKVCLLVNVASKCGLTPQYKGLQELYQEKGPKGFEILGIPCNQFGKQEPGQPEEIQTFCEKNYGVSFPMFSKIEVNGAGSDPLYVWLKSEGNNFPGEIEWNFEKFLVDKKGQLVKRFSPQVPPNDPALLKEIVRLLAE